MKKEIGIIGLGRMGSNMVLNLLDKKWKVTGYNRSQKKTKELTKKSMKPSFSLEEFSSKLPQKKVIWIMIKSGKPVDQIIKKLLPYLRKGDIIIDGGNSFYENSIKRYKFFKKKGIHFIDCGVSGGLEGARKGACMMVGGEKKIFDHIKNLFKDLTVKDGFGYMGKPGAGHFVKGIHNAIEYGMMGALNEGFEALKRNKKKFGTNLKEVAKVYNNGSIIEGRLTNWLYDAFKKPMYLDEISCEVPEGETEKEMKKLEKVGGKMPILRQAHLMRKRSRKDGVCGQIISALRNEFGGHKTIQKK